MLYPAMVEYQGDTCFYCYEKIKPGFDHVQWIGKTVIELHPECAGELGNHLIMDFQKSREADAHRM